MDDSFATSPSEETDLTSSEMLGAFGALQSLLLSTESVEEFLTDVAKLAADVVVPPAACGITLRRQGQPVTAASSDARAQVVDQLQYQVDEGPCLDALATGAQVDVPDMAVEDRWPRFRQHAMEQGVRCSLSVPLMVDRRSVGALNLYGFTERAFEHQRSVVDGFATHAAAGLTLMLRHVAMVKTSEQLEQALLSRTIIDQALGILMAQQHCTAAEAFALLRAHSQNTNRKVRDVATDLVTRVAGEAPGAGPSFARNGEPG